MVGGSSSAQATGEPTQADHAAAASSALTGRDALLANLGSDVVSARIKTLKAQRQQMLAEKKAVARALKNAQRQRNRLKRKAKNLSTDDLVEVLTMRGAAQRAKAEAAVAGAEETPSAETTE